jgi:hypothetical protein
MLQRRSGQTESAGVQGRHRALTQRACVVALLADRCDAQSEAAAHVVLEGTAGTHEELDAVEHALTSLARLLQALVQVVNVQPSLYDLGQQHIVRMLHLGAVELLRTAHAQSQRSMRPLQTRSAVLAVGMHALAAGGELSARVRKRHSGTRLRESHSSEQRVSHGSRTPTSGSDAGAGSAPEPGGTCSVAQAQFAGRTCRGQPRGANRGQRRS